MQLKYRIHFTYPNGDEEYVEISGSDIEELRLEAALAVDSRGGLNPWSEEITE